MIKEPQKCGGDRLVKQADELQPAQPVQGPVESAGPPRVHQGVGGQYAEDVLAQDFPGAQEMLAMRHPNRQVPYRHGQGQEIGYRQGNEQE